MEKIEISTPEPERVLPVLQDALERQKRLLSQSLARTDEKIEHLAAHLQVTPIVFWPENFHILRKRTWSFWNWKASWSYAATYASNWRSWNTSNYAPKRPCGSPRGSDRVNAFCDSHISFV